MAKSRKKEVYFAGKRNSGLPEFSKKQLFTLRKFRYFERAVTSRLGELVNLQEQGVGGGVYVSNKDILKSDITLKVSEFLSHPGEMLSYSEFELTYNGDASEQELEIFREAMRMYGLEKKTH